jgi:hypothetical protein
MGTGAIVWGGREGRDMLLLRLNLYHIRRKSVLTNCADSTNGAEPNQEPKSIKPLVSQAALNIWKLLPREKICIRSSSGLA